MLKKIFKSAKKLVQKAAPVIGAGLGYLYGGPALGGALGSGLGAGIGSLVGGRSPQESLRNALLGGAAGYGANVAIIEGDQIGGPYELAQIFSKSLEYKNGFDESDLRNRYLDWWRGDAFDTGPTYASVFNKINKGMDPKLAVKKVHEEFGLNTAGCGPAHRASPLAGMTNIPANQLVFIAREEAKITHYDVEAGNGSAIFVMLCRYLLEGKSLEEAESHISIHKDLKDSWIKLQNAELKPDGYIYNVIFSALHFIKQNKTLKESIKFSGKANYSSIIFSVLDLIMRNNQKLS